MNVGTPVESPRLGQSDSPAAPSTPKARHRCFLCDRTYERHDHLNRHLKTHDNERAYRCPDCGKGFNRADLLNRHRAAHAKVSQGEPMRKRIEKACEACIRAKTKCDDDRPCKRCKKRKVECVDTEERRNSMERRASTSISNDQANEVAIMGPPDQLDPLMGMGTGTSNPMQLPAQMSHTGTSDDTNTLLGPPSDMGNFDFNFGFPDFFEQIMMPIDPGMTAAEAVMMPPDVSNFTQDIDFGSADLDFSFLSDGLAKTPAPFMTIPSTDSAGRAESGATPASEAGSRSEALHKAPWSWNQWIPPRGWHAFSDHPELDVQEDRVNAADQLTSPSARQNFHCSLDYEARDRMMRVVTQCTVHRLSVPSFPSLQLLEDLIDVALLQDSYAIDSMIHAPLFDPRKTRTELLLALVSKGAGFVALPPIWRMGLVLQEVVRFAVGEAFEKDNSATRELQAVQTSVLWLPIGVWSGFRRKTEIACSFSQPPITMLTWSDAFSCFRYKQIVPTLHDSDDILEQKWREWAAQEGWKRLVFNIFLHDSQVMLTQLRSPLISPAQLQLPVPAARELWLAPNAHAWRSAFLSRQTPDGGPLPSCMDILGDATLIGSFKAYADKPLCQMLVAHALAHDVFEYRQQTQLFRYYSGRRQRDRGLAIANRLREIHEDLTSYLTWCETDPATPSELTFTVQFLLMELHVSLDDVQIFAGRAGEEEARKIFPQIRNWTEDAESRIAVWHAGQVIRAARSFEKTRLRDFYAVAVHHAALTLWVYGMVTSNTSRQSGLQTPVGQKSKSLARYSETFPADFSRHKVLLDTDDEKSVRAFTQLGRGVPGLQQPTIVKMGVGEVQPDSAGNVGSFCALYNSKGVMSVAAGTLRGNFPQTKQGLPPLVENLANLMDELGNLPS